MKVCGFSGCGCECEGCSLFCAKCGHRFAEFSADLVVNDGNPQARVPILLDTQLMRRKASAYWAAMSPRAHPH